MKSKNSFVLVEIFKRYFQGFDYLTENIFKLNLFKRFFLLSLTLLIYPISLFVVLFLFLFGKLSVAFFKVWNKDN
ncbi:hypothetical protein HOD02_04415 [bacterium]|nr:hypothetical protein [bacterium]